MKITLRFFFTLLILNACRQEAKEEIVLKTTPDHLVLISVNAPEEQYRHYLKNDSLGKEAVTEGIYQPVFNRFSYWDEDRLLKEWVPQPHKTDTLVVTWHSGEFELVSKHPFAAMPNSFLLQKGDTVVFEYQNNIPMATVTNRTVNDSILNFHHYRLKELFDNKYTSHWLVTGEMFLNPTLDFEQDSRKSVEHYLQAKKDANRESRWLNSLPIPENEKDYRLRNLEMVMEKHRQFPSISKFEKSMDLTSEELKPAQTRFDLEKADSLMRYHSFRTYLSFLSNYDLPKRMTKHQGGGSFVSDSRAKFDSIAADMRFSASAKDYLLAQAYESILLDFPLEERKAYFQKLKTLVSNPKVTEHLAEKHQLDFGLSEVLLVTDQYGKETTFSEVIAANKGSWLYIDFWAAWCAPCIALKPKAQQLELDLQGQPITFLYFAFNDNREKWQASAEPDNEQRKSYFVLNSKTSNVPEKLHINSLPHYLIYDPSGGKVVDYAKRPGEGALEELKALMQK